MAKRRSIIVLFLFFSQSVMAIDRDVSMKGTIETLYEYVNYLEDSLSQEIVHLHADIITEDGITFTRTLYEGWNYGIAAFGDRRINDLDIIVYKEVDGEWREITKDNKTDAHPVVSVKPSHTGKYLIELKVYKFNNNYSAAHYGMVIFHEYRE